MDKELFTFNNGSAAGWHFDCILQARDDVFFVDPKNGKKSMCASLTDQPPANIPFRVHIKQVVFEKVRMNKRIITIGERAAQR
jgi:hypothetical protein